MQFIKAGFRLKKLQDSKAIFRKIMFKAKHFKQIDPTFISPRGGTRNTS